MCNRSIRSHFLQSNIRPPWPRYLSFCCSVQTARVCKRPPPIILGGASSDLSLHGPDSNSTATKPQHEFTSATTMLTPAFARGWRKLPNELKLEVLAYLLPHKATLAASILSETSRRSWHNPVVTQDDKCSISHLWLLLEHPDFAALSRDVFFANNTITMQAHGPSYDMPAPKMAALLQHLSVTLAPTYSQWRWLAHFAADLGIGRLQSLELVFELQHWVYYLPKFYDEVDFACPIGLNVKSLSIRYEHRQQPVTASYPKWDLFWGAYSFKEELDRFNDAYVPLLILI